jgi:hypothetical protein
VQLASAHLQNRLKLAATTTATVLRRISLTLSLSLSFSSLSLFLLSLSLSPLFKIATKSAAASLVDATPYSRHFSLFCFFSFCGETSFCIHWLGSKTQTLTLKIPCISLSLFSFFFSFSLSPVLSKIVLTFLSSL